MFEATLLQASDEVAAAAEEGFFAGAETVGTVVAVVPIVTTAAAALAWDFLGAIVCGGCGRIDGGHTEGGRETGGLGLFLETVGNWPRRWFGSGLVFGCRLSAGWINQW